MMIRGLLWWGVLVLGMNLPAQDTAPSAESAPATREDELPKVDVAGTVLGPDGSPSPGARVHWFWPFEQGRPAAEEALTADHQGAFRGTLTMWMDAFALVAYSKDDRLAGLVEMKKGAPGNVVIKLAPAVRVKAKVAQDAEGRKLVPWFNSTWRVCHREPSQHLLDFLGRRRENEIQVAMMSAEGGELDLRLPAGSYDYDVYDSDFVTKTGHVAVPAGKEEADLGTIVVPPSFLARHDGKLLPEWKVAAARGVDAKKAQIADFRGKWLLVEFWGFW
jgi:hypothetical protein